jgi:hypothetical protein
MKGEIFSIVCCAIGAISAAVQKNWLACGWAFCAALWVANYMCLKRSRQ